MSIRNTHKHFHFAAAALVAVVLLAVFILWSAPSIGPAGQEASSGSNPNALIESRKTRILSIASAIASSGTPLTVGEKQLFFESLSGPQMLQYRFSQDEKLRIIQALNAGEKSTAASGGVKK